MSAVFVGFCMGLSPSDAPAVELDVNFFNVFSRSFVAFDVPLVRSVVALNVSFVTSTVAFVIQPDRIISPRRNPPEYLVMMLPPLSIKLIVVRCSSYTSFSLIIRLGQTIGLVWLTKGLKGLSAPGLKLSLMRDNSQGPSHGDVNQYSWLSIEPESISRVLWEVACLDW